jgi:hypothetical protein
MTPTSKLRFVWRDVEMVKDSPPLRVRVLQQFWERKVWAHDVDIVVEAEWRDVPTEINND